MSAEVEPFSTTAQVAEFLGKPLSWVYDNAGPLGIPRVLIGRQYRYRLSKVAEWAEAQGATGETPAEPAPLALVSDQ